MTDLTPEIVMKALAAVRDPDLDDDIVSLGMVKGVQTRDGHVAFGIEVEAERGTQMEPLRKEAEKTVQSLPGVLSVTAVLTAERAPEKPAQAPPPPARESELLPGVGAIIAIASGKGGVGKSTTAVNLALATARDGQSVGLLDADVYGPSIPRMMGITDKPVSPDGKRLLPMANHGITCMSMGFLVEEDTPMIWRGPMATGALEQLLRDVDWGDLDVLFIDLPPGTGDIHLSICQRVALTGAVIVSTPQDIALADARKGLNMFRRVNVPVMGIIENMSYFVCPDTGKRYDIFGHGGARREAERMDVEFLGEIPLDMTIRETSDSGNPIVVSEPENAHALAYCEIAGKLRAAVAEIQAQGGAPNIVIQ